MADQNGSRTAVSIVGILAILVLVGMVIYFVSEQTNDADLEIDIGAALGQDAPAHVMAAPPPPPPAGIHRIA